MKLTIDTVSRVLSAEDRGASREFPLYSREAFELVSREWVRIGWGVHYYFTMTWLGQPILQLPEDLVRLQEVLNTLRPDVILETGVYSGGSLLFHATVCEALGKGRVIGIDVRIPDPVRESLTRHRLAPRISLIEGDSISPEVVESVRSLIRPEDKVLVILDSDHSRRHVERELEVWAPFVTPGSCIIATDGIMRDLSDVPGGQSGWVQDNPSAAAGAFLAAHPEFELRQPAWPFNESELRQNITYWPDGWLWRKGPADA